MIIIDGQQSEHSVNNFENLEDLLNKVMAEDHFGSRIVTDVLVNDELFSEIYPHQAEDIERDELEKVEIISVPKGEMADKIVREMAKVVFLMEQGGKQVAKLFRQAEDLEALDTYQDLLEVARDFLGMIGTLQDELSLTSDENMGVVLGEFSTLLTEMIDVQENEDWVLLADLVEYEFVPVVQKWQAVVTTLQNAISNANA